MKRIVLPVLAAAPLVVGAFWLFTQEKRPSNAALPPAGVQFALPLECSDPTQCTVQNHVDLKPGPGVADASCGIRTYDEHHGVDFRVRDLPAMMAGVPVRAAAAGTVTSVRDGEYDGAWNAKGRAAVGSLDCGNGVTIAHEDGYETFYCHMRRDSVRVSEGQTVAQGEELGAVGMSGRAEFPHLHFAVVKDGARLDPFSGRKAGEDCGIIGATLWREEVPPHLLAGTGPRVFKSGFTERPVPNLAMVERGLPTPTPKARVMAFYARTLGLEEGDIQRIQIEGPEGFVPVGMVDDPLTESTAHSVRFVARPATTGEEFPVGIYRGSYQVERDGQTILAHEDTFVLK